MPHRRVDQGQQGQPRRAAYDGYSNRASDSKAEWSDRYERPARSERASREPYFRSSRPYSTKRIPDLSSEESEYSGSSLASEVPGPYSHQQQQQSQYRKADRPSAMGRRRPDVYSDSSEASYSDSLSSTQFKQRYYSSSEDTAHRRASTSRHPSHPRGMSNESIDQRDRETLVAEQQERQKWIQSMNVYKQARTAALRAGRTPPTDPVLAQRIHASQKITGHSAVNREPEAARLATQAEILRLTEDVQAYRGGLKLQRTRLRLEIDALQLDPSAEDEGDEPDNLAQREYGLHKMRLQTLLSGQPDALLRGQLKHLKLARKVATLRQTLTTLERDLLALPKTASARVTSRRPDLEWDANLAVEVGNAILHEARRGKLMSAEYTELATAYTAVLEKVGAIRKPVEDKEFEEDLALENLNLVKPALWARQNAIKRFKPSRPMALVQSPSGVRTQRRMFLPAFGQARSSPFEVTLKGKRLECIDGERSQILHGGKGRPYRAW